jgi:hypothetical protein
MVAGKRGIEFEGQQVRHTDSIFLCWWKSKIALCEACGVLFVGINEVLLDWSCHVV